jgi:hypothetical protein
MELTRHLGRQRVGFWVVVVSAALCAELVAAAPASAKDPAEYEALLPAPAGQSSWLDFKVKSKKDRRTKKFSPVAVKKVSVAFLQLKCTDQEPTRTSFTWGELKASVPGLQDPIPVSGRRFSLSATGGGQTTGGSDTFTFTFSGRVPRNGLPSGTVRYTTTFPRFTSDPADPQAPGTYVQVTCDSGPLSWTAKRLPEGTL